MVRSLLPPAGSGLLGCLRSRMVVFLAGCAVAVGLASALAGPRYAVAHGPEGRHVTSAFSGADAPVSPVSSSPQAPAGGSSFSRPVTSGVAPVATGAVSVVAAASGPPADQGGAARPEGAAPAAKARATQGAPTGQGAAAGAPSIEVMAGQMLMLGFRGAEPAEAASIMEQVRAGHVGGVILFDRDMDRSVSVRNVVSKGQLSRLTSALQAAAPVPLFIAVDQEGGKVRRLKPDHGFFAYPSAATMSKGTPEDTRKMAATLGTEMADAGLNVDFGPVVDLAINADSPVIARLERSFGREPCRVASHAAAFVNGLAWRGVISVLKHFPGHGSSLQDSHLGVTDVSGTWRREELIPYGLLLRDDWAGMVMVGHLYNNRVDAAHPATLSKNTIEGLLRRDLGWKGVVVTDDLQMGAITARYTLDETILLAVDAGVDILLFGNNLVWDPDLAGKAHATLVRLVQEGRISPQRLRASWERIMRLKSVLGVPSPGAVAAGQGGAPSRGPSGIHPDPFGGAIPLRLTLPMPSAADPLCRDDGTGHSGDSLDGRRDFRRGNGAGAGVGIGIGSGGRTGVGVGGGMGF